MAIVRTDINGDIAAMKAALETLVPDFFATVEYDDTTTPTAINCKDADDNTLFIVNTANSGWTFSFYKDGSTVVSSQGTTSTAAPVYCYKVGSASAVIQHPNGQFSIISKTNTGGVGFAIPTQFSYTANKGEYRVGCWGDDTLITTNLLFTSSTSGAEMVGNQCQLVEIPMHGTYDQPIYLQSAYYMPMAQSGMRGVVQEITGERGTYLTNGYVALLDN